MSIVAIAAVSLMAILVAAYMWKRFRARPHPAQVKPTPPTSLTKVEEEVVKKFMKPMYKPQEVGHRTGHYKLFQTNKGVRRYEVNELGFPMPPLGPLGPKGPLGNAPVVEEPPLIK